MPLNRQAAASVGLALAAAVLLAPVATQATLVDRTVFAEEFGYRT